MHFLDRVRTASSRAVAIGAGIIHDRIYQNLDELRVVVLEFVERYNADGWSRRTAI